MSAWMPVIAILVGAGGDAAFAQQAAIPTGPSTNCTCRYQGNKYHLGETVCLRSPQGLRMAQCDMVLNNTSWNFTGTECTISLQTVPNAAALVTALADQK